MAKVSRIVCYPCDVQCSMRCCMKENACDMRPVAGFISQWIEGFRKALALPNSTSGLYFLLNFRMTRIHPCVENSYSYRLSIIGPIQGHRFMDNLLKFLKPAVSRFCAKMLFRQDLGTATYSLSSASWRNELKSRKFSVRWESFIESERENERWPWQCGSVCWANFGLLCTPGKPILETAYFGDE